MSLSELWARTWGDRDLFDVLGFMASASEWGLLYVLAGKGGKLTREQLRHVYDGTIFYELEREHAARPRRGAQPA